MKISNLSKIAGLLVLLFFSCTPSSDSPQVGEHSGFYKPWESLGPLFHDVQMAGIYPDSKTFVDCVPKSNPYAIAALYEKQKQDPAFDIKAFVTKHFALPEVAGKKYTLEKGFFREHLNNQWGYLTRRTEAEDNISTLIGLQEEYVVPGGRFREVYYWDSYFTMIGLGVSGKTDLVGSMLNNFAFLIDSVGFIPNANRTYYLGRSQPPYFAGMVRLYMGLTRDENGLKYLPAIQKEYDFWMQGIDQLSDSNQVVNRVVQINDSVVLNRYWDFLDFPRPESYKEDVELAEGLQDSEKARLYRNLRAGAESGWDYSTRWFKDKNEFSSIRTVEMLPVDLNCLMYSMEKTLAGLYDLAGNGEDATYYEMAAVKRKQAIQTIFWNEEVGAFTDYVWTDRESANQLTMAGMYPLYFKVASQDQARDQANILEKEFLLPGGLVTTTIESGQQWDYPNGWAPLQWIGIKGLQQYGYEDLADEVKSRWVRTNQKVYSNTGKMMEKYNVADTTLLAGGGEYPTQDGFGWTNGVALGMLAEDPAY